MYEKSEYILFIWYLYYNEKSKIFTYLVYVLQCKEYNIPISIFIAMKRVTCSYTSMYCNDNSRAFIDVVRFELFKAANVT